MTDLTVADLVLANLALAAGACLQGVAGYGIGTLSAPLLFLISPTFLPGVMIVDAVLLNVLMLIRNRTSITLSPVRYAIAGSIVGITLASATLTVLSDQGFELAFGTIILVAVLLSVIGFRPALSAQSSLIAGGLSGYMGTITAVGGPPMALIYQNEKGPLVRANLSAFFVASSLITVAALIPLGHIGTDELKLVTMTAPGVLFGFWLSRHLIHRLAFNALRPIILAIAGMAGASALMRGILEY